MLNQHFTMTVKTRATDLRYGAGIPSLHRDNFLAKEPGLWPVLASGNMPALQAGSSLSRHFMSGLNARPSLLPGSWV
jgi:hypothetical protein